MLWKKSEDDSNKGVTGPAIFGHRDAFMVVQECCQRKLPAMVVVPDTGMTCKGTFDRTTPDMVLLSATKEESLAYRPQSVCFIVFSLEARGFMFPASVLDRNIHPAATEKHITLGFPEYLVAMEIRQWFRITVPRNTALAVHVLDPGGAVLKPRALNISLGGILIDFDEGACPSVHEGGSLRMKLTHEGTTIKFNAEVRRRQETEFGLAISSDTHDTQDYRQIVTAVEREWLQQRAMFERG